MFLTFFYMIATALQARRISFIKTNLSSIFKKTNHVQSSVMFYAKVLPSSNKECDTGTTVLVDKPAEHFLTSDLCSNKNIAKLENLLWFQDEAGLYTIYPEQHVSISDWLIYQYGSFIPWHTHKGTKITLHSDHRMYVLVEADLSKPYLSPTTVKLEDYGIIIAWTADTNINVIMETDMDHITQFVIAAMHGQRYINHGLLLTRIETVLTTGKPCYYDSKQLKKYMSKKIVGKLLWKAYVQHFRMLSSAARSAYQQNVPVEVEELSGVVILPAKLLRKSQTSATKESTDSTEAIEKPAVDRVSVGTATCRFPNLPTHYEECEESEAEENTPEVEEVLNIPKNNTDNESKEQSIYVDHTETSSMNITTNFEESNTVESQNDAITSKVDTKESTVLLGNGVTKPPNIFIYSDSAVAFNNVKTVLETTLGTNRYVIYPLLVEDARNNVWMDQAALVVVCGNIGIEIGTQLVEYVISGGKLLALCSDMLYTLLPSFKTAEVREHELVRFSYDKWKNVHMMHHIFCYQASPVRTRFSQDQEDARMAILHPPVSADIKDKSGLLHSFNVKVLGTEETWHTPSILLASLPSSGGRVIFSQIHLEVDPTQYEFEESKFNVLKQSNTARMEIFADLLTAHLEMKVDDVKHTPVIYKSGFFLGRHELKLGMLEKLSSVMETNNILKMQKLSIQFCKNNAETETASSSVLPIMMYQCPDNFSTVEYFENLTTKELGRLVIYADVLGSSMDVVTGHRLQHGLAVITRQQTQARGRSNNIWLSPEGCAVFTLQLHIPVNSPLGTRISLLQCLVAAAVISAVKSLPGYEDIDLKIKWPNDIYAADTVKIGGILATTQVESSLNISNIGVGVNLSNSAPTSCINNIIAVYNQTHCKKLTALSYERYLALVFNEIEMLFSTVQNGNMDYLYNVYYKHWMHTGSKVVVKLPNGVSQNVKILGIDEFGFLKVQGEEGNVFSVHPDGNSFDLLKGLIAPRIK